MGITQHVKCTQNGISIEKEEQNNDADPMNISTMIEEKERREKERAHDLDLEILIERTTTDDGATDDGRLCVFVLWFVSAAQCSLVDTDEYEYEYRCYEYHDLYPYAYELVSPSCWSFVGVFGVQGQVQAKWFSPFANEWSSDTKASPAAEYPQAQQGEASPYASLG